MEDVLEVYTQPYDPQRPQICMDETSKQLLADVVEPLPMLPGKPERVDYEYQREGVADLFMFFEPLAGKRYVKVTDHRTRKDGAEAMRKLADVNYPDAKKIEVDPEKWIVVSLAERKGKNAKKSYTVRSSVSPANG